MQDPHRMHKEVPAGWMTFAQQLMQALRERKAEELDERCAVAHLPGLPGDLYNLAGPH